MTTGTPSDGEHPYRPRPKPLVVSDVTQIDFDELDNLVGRLRHAMLKGAFDGAKRSSLVPIAINLETIYAKTSRRLSSTATFLAAFTGILLALAALAGRVLIGWPAAVVPLVLVGLSVFLASTIAIVKGQEATLARAKDAYTELQKQISTLPVDEDLAHELTSVRVDLGSLDGREPVEVIDEKTKTKREQRP